MAITVANSSNAPMAEDSPMLCGGKRFRGITAQSTPAYPLVTVVTATFNARPFIAECLESVWTQDYPNIEHIVLDGASRDGTIEVLREYDDRIAFWKSEPDKGIYDAWNKALAEARGEWICFLGADDEFLPGAVSAYMALAAKFPEAEYLSSQIRWVHPSGYVNPAHGRPWTWREFARRMCVAHPGSMHRFSLFGRLGVYDTTYRSAADYELLLRARDTLRTAYLPATTVMMRAGGASDSSIALVEAYRAKRYAGGRNAFLASAELCEARVRFRLLPFRRALMSLISGSKKQVGRF